MIVLSALVATASVTAVPDDVLAPGDGDVGLKLWLYAGFVTIVVLLLALDLGVFHRRAHVVGMREALAWTSIWVTTALLFSVAVHAMYDARFLGLGVDVPVLGRPGETETLSAFEAWKLFVTGYLVEESLSLDNVFVIAVVFASLRIPAAYQHRVLFWGILGALVMRGLMILAGYELVTRLWWITYVFGGFLVVTAARMALIRGDTRDPGAGLAMRLGRRLLRVTRSFDGQRLTTRIDGRLHATPLLLALVLVELTDVVFALDSIPAIFAITADPFLVFTSNVFAILGLRSLYFCLAALVGALRYLKPALIAVLMFAGVKLCLVHTPLKVPTDVALAVVLALLGSGVVASLVSRRRAGAEDPRPGAERTVRRARRDADSDVADPVPVQGRISKRAAGRRLPVWRRLLFAMVPLLGLLLLGEVVIRLFRAPFFFESYRLLRVDQAKRGYPAVRDPYLGYVPKANYATDESLWDKRVTIDARGFRANGDHRPYAGTPILAVGDSFTFGDEVHDEESWPAYLEHELRRPVINGGVFGYSLTQIVLRAERVLPDLGADRLIVAFIPDDIVRCEYGRRYVSVPYFEVEDGELALRNVPVTDRMTPEEERVRRFKNALGYSALLDAVLAHTAREWWMGDEVQVRALPEGAGAEVALLLVDRIAAFCRERDVELMLVLQGTRSSPAADAVLDRARSLEVETLDLIAELERERKSDPDLEERLFEGHMSAEGNRWVAAHIAARIRRGSR